MVAVIANARVTVAGFMTFIVASVAWMADGWFKSKTSLVIQNAVLLFINVQGDWRWLPRAGREAGMSEGGARFKDEKHAGRAGES
jgi:hypothetical protein